MKKRITDEQIIRILQEVEVQQDQQPAEQAAPSWGDREHRLRHSLLLAVDRKLQREIRGSQRTTQKKS